MIAVQASPDFDAKTGPGRSSDEIKLLGWNVFAFTFGMVLLGTSSF